MSRRSSIIVERFRVLGAVGLCFVTGFMIAYFVLPTQKPLYTLLKSTSVASQSSDVQKQSDACIHRLVCEIHASKNPKDVEKLGKAARHFQRFFRLAFEKPDIAGAGGRLYPYHFAVHMGSLLENTLGCHKLYPSCPLSTDQVAKVLSRAHIV